MSKIGLTKASFVIQCRSLENERVLKTVRGHTLYYRGHKLGIYRREHIGSKRQKYEYVLIDLATGLAIAIRPRKIYLVEDMEHDRGEYLKGYLKIIESDFYKKQVKEFSEMKKQGGPINEK